MLSVLTSLRFVLLQWISAISTMLGKDGRRTSSTGSLPRWRSAWSRCPARLPWWTRRTVSPSSLVSSCLYLCQWSAPCRPLAVLYRLLSTSSVVIHRCFTRPFEMFVKSTAISTALVECSLCSRFASRRKCGTVLNDC